MWIYVVGGLDFFFHTLGIIIPTDFNMFQRGGSTTNQIFFDVGDVFFLGVFWWFTNGLFSWWQFRADSKQLVVSGTGHAQTYTWTLS